MKHSTSANAAMENFIETLLESFGSLLELLSNKRQKRVKILFQDSVTLPCNKVKGSRKRSLNTPNDVTVVIYVTFQYSFFLGAEIYQTRFIFSRLMSFYIAGFTVARVLLRAFIPLQKYEVFH